VPDYIIQDKLIPARAERILKASVATLLQLSKSDKHHEESVNKMKGMYDLVVYYIIQGLL